MTSHPLLLFMALTLASFHSLSLGIEPPSAIELSREQDELQADAFDLIAEQTDEKVITLLEKCRHAMNDAVDLLEKNETGGETLAAQSEVMERIYQTAKQHNSTPDGKMKPGAKGMMDMMRQMLGMNDENIAPPQTQNNENPLTTEQKFGQSSGKQVDGVSNLSSEQIKGVSNPNILKEPRVVPHATGTSPSEMPQEFQKALEAYNKTLQQ
ncbi:MAG: hypothetical protein RR250_03610 [Akkermansia sp.]